MVRNFSITTEPEEGSSGGSPQHQSILCNQTDLIFLSPNGVIERWGHEVQPFLALSMVNKTPWV